ncbi:MAG: hypothetical protein F4X66_10235 [Chloroflexi bacterium]|nr:hypothetical protein [Chloroflexota bacterium]
MTTQTLGGFCRELLDDDPYGQAIDPERLAGRFVDHFGLSARPNLVELIDLAERAGFGTVREGKMEGLKGAHVGQPGASTTSTTGMTCGRVPRPRPYSTRCTRSSWSAWPRFTRRVCPSPPGRTP